MHCLPGGALQDGTIFSEDKLAAALFEQGHIKNVLEGAKLLADCAGRYMQFSRCRTKVA
jgi:hypothetical protein